MKYISFDPGETTGWASFDEEGRLHKAGYSKGLDQFYDWLDSHSTFEGCGDLNTVIIEEFRLYPWKSDAQKWSQFKTVEVIGAIKFWARSISMKMFPIWNIQHQIQVVEQPANIKAIGYKWAMCSPLPKSNPRNHELDAYVHGVYYLQNKAIRKLRLAQEM